MLEPRDRRLLVVIAVSTTAIAIFLIVGFAVSIVLATHGGSSGGVVTVQTYTAP